MAESTDDRAEPPIMGTLGIGVMLLGGVLLLFSFTTLAWYQSAGRADVVSTSREFGDLRQLTESFDAPAASTAYFGWLAWSLLIALIIVGFAANLPTPAANVLRVLGLALGMGGAALTYYALWALFDAAKERGGTGEVFVNDTWGLWLALAGFALAGLGSAIGPRHAK